MTPEQNDLSRQLIAHPSFRWAPGMFYGDVTTDTVWRVLVVGPDAVCAYGVDTGHVALNSFARLTAECLVDLCDAATAGCLLGMLTALYPSTFVAFEPDEFHAAESPLHVAVTCYGPDEAAGGHQSGGATLGEACARALLALWGTP